jgi:Protein of unknown function (DUF3606)
VSGKEAIMFDNESNIIDDFLYTPNRGLVVNRYDEDDVAHWTARLRCSPGQLLHAIGIVGVNIRAIENYFAGRAHGAR